MNLRWLFGRTVQPAAPIAPPARAALDPRKFDALGDDLSPLTKRVRREVIAARKAEKTAALARVAAARLTAKNSNQGAHQ